jgi:Tfp pilus assembly protein PilF
MLKFLRHISPKNLMSLSLVSGILFASCTSKEQPQALDEKAAIQYQFAYDTYIKGDLIVALTYALKAESLSPRNPETLNLLGLIYFQQEKFKESEEKFLKAAALDPKLSEVHNNLGTLYFSMKRYDDALNALDAALKNPLYLNPERIHNNRGLVYEAMGRPREAVDEYQTAIRFDKKFYLPYQNLGKLHYNAKHFNEAKPLLEAAAKLCPECSEARYFLGSLLLKESKASEALRLFKEGADADPSGYYGQLCKKFMAP